MTDSPTGTAALDALAQRLGEIAPQLDPSHVVDLDVSSAERCDQLLGALLDAVRSSGDRSAIWLLLVGVRATFPTREEVRDVQRRLALDRVADVERWLLGEALGPLRSQAGATRELVLVRSRVLVDVNFSAKYDLNTGIQRVVRHVAPRWKQDRDVELVVWTEAGGAYRRPVGHERSRVLRWGQHPPVIDAVDDHRMPLLVPWETTVVIPEVPGASHLDRLVGLAEDSGNRVVAIGYDCIPIVAADLMSEAEPTRFVHYLTLIKHCTTVAAISDAVGDEFHGFSRSLSTQGLAGPEVVVCPLGVDAPPDDVPAESTVRPEVLVVGSHDKRKNQAAVLHASELLWREGLDFTLRLIGHRGFGAEVLYNDIDRLRQRGRAIEVNEGLGDRDLWEAYRRARFTVFVSLQEGYGLPVVESLSFGTPVIASSYGSVAEVAAGGGAMLVDPRDDLAIVGAMRTLLTDDDLRNELAGEAAARSFRTWETYADALWTDAVAAS